MVMKIFINKHRKNMLTENLSYDGVEFINSPSAQSDADLIFSEKIYWNEYVKDIKHFHDNPNHVINISLLGMRVREKRNLRANYNVDNCIDIPYDKIQNIMLSHFDFYKKNNIIPTFRGPTGSNLLNKPESYWITDKLPKNDKFHNKAFWRSRVSTHGSRKEFYKFYNNINDSRFEIEDFKLNIYQKQGTSEQFDSYMNELCNKDIVFVLRGDRTWANSFYDVIRAGCIPVMISSMNDFGWESIMNNVDDYFLRFDIRTQTMDYIHEEVCKLLDNKDRVLEMKANIRKLYKTFFSHSCSFGASDFIWGKCLNIHKNNCDLTKIDDKFICSDVLELKGLPGKL